MVIMLREYSVDVIHATTDKDTIYSLLTSRASRDGQGIIAQWQDNQRQWHNVTCCEMLKRVHEVAKGMMVLGVKPGSMVVIYSPTCYEWGVVDFACAAIGAVSVPVYETDSARQAANIVDDVEPVIAFAGGDNHARVLEELRDDHESLQYVFSLSASGLDAVADFGRGISDDELQQAIERVKADDLATIVYTSGSTGRPKGAMLSHRNFTHIVYAGYDVLNDMLYQPSRLLLFLPLAHCFARYIQYVAIGANGVVGYIPNADHLLADLREFKPTYLLGVPRVFEKVYNAASQKAGTGIKGLIFAKAVDHFTQWSKNESEGVGHTVSERVRHMFYMKAVGSSVRSALGPNLKYLACGGAPMNADLAHFFNGMDGITFIQGYGMTETAAPCVVNFEDANEVGSVGRPGPGITVRLKEDDEVMVKGPNVFLGYYRQPELTAEVLSEDGWLHSGDLGRINDQGFLFITGRKKDIIITAGGKNISPAPLEDIISTCPIISHTVVVGDGRPFVSALIALDDEMTATWLSNQGLDPTMSAEQLNRNDAVRAFIQQYVDRANVNVSRAESVRKFTILDHDFNQEEGTLTPSMKVIRPKVLQRYAGVIDNVLYAPKNATRPVSATVRIIDKTSETVRQTSEKVRQTSEKMRQASENVSPKVRQALDQAKTNMSDSIASVSEMIKRQQDTDEKTHVFHDEDFSQPADNNDAADMR